MKGCSHTYTCIDSPPKPPPIQAENSIEQSYMCYMIGPHWLSILFYFYLFIYLFLFVVDFVIHWLSILNIAAYP